MSATIPAKQADPTPGFWSGLLRWSDWLSRHADGLMLVFVVLFLVVGIATLPHYGMTWDEGLGNFFFGERYLRYLTSFADKYLDFKADLGSLKNLPLHLYLSPYRDHPYHYPPVVDILSAATMYLFSYRLGWMDPVDGFHALKIVMAAVFLWTLYRFAASRLGKYAAFIAVALLAVFPRFWGDVHFNPKDIPELIFYSLTIMAYVLWYEKPDWISALVVGVLFGSALGTKANAVFLPVVLVLGVWPLGFSLHSLKKVFLHLKLFWAHYIVMGLSGLMFYFITWPYLYADPKRVKMYWDFILDRGVREGHTAWNWRSPLQVVTTMPEWMLVLLVIGVVLVAIRAFREKHYLWRLLLVWLTLPIFRISLPGMVDFDGIRHFMEFLPAAALIAGYGAAALPEILAKGRAGLKVCLKAVMVLVLVWNVTAIQQVYSQYEYLYYNRLVGGLTGAQEIFGKSEATDYWASTYRKGMAWLNANAEQDAGLYVPVADWLVQITGPLYLRPDIRVLNGEDPGSLSGVEGPIYVMFVTRTGFYDEIAKDLSANDEPEYQIVVDGVSILQIHKIQGKW